MSFGVSLVLFSPLAANLSQTNRRDRKLFLESIEIKKRKNTVQSKEKCSIFAIQIRIFKENR